MNDPSYDYLIKLENEILKIQEIYNKENMIDDQIICKLEKFKKKLLSAECIKINLISIYEEYKNLK